MIGSSLFNALSLAALSTSSLAAPLTTGNSNLHKRNAICPPQPLSNLQIHSNLDTRAGWLVGQGNETKLGSVVDIRDFGTMDPTPENSVWNWTLTGDGRPLYQIQLANSSDVCAGVSNTSTYDDPTVITVPCANDTQGVSNWWITCLGADGRCQGAISECQIQSYYSGYCATMDGSSSTLLMKECVGINATESNPFSGQMFGA